MREKKKKSFASQRKEEKFIKNLLRIANEPKLMSHN